MKRLIAILFFIAFASVARADGPLLLHGVLTPNNCLVAISANTVEDGGFVCAGGAGGPFLPLSGGTMTGSIVPASAGSISLGSVSLPFLATTTRSIGSDGDLNVLDSSSSGMWRFTNLGNIVNTSANTQVIGWSNAGSGTLDTGISRGAAATFDFGNGTAQNVSGTIKATAYFSGATAGVSCAAGTVSLTTFTVTNGIVTHC